MKMDYRVKSLFTLFSRLFISKNPKSYFYNYSDVSKVLLDLPNKSESITLANIALLRSKSSELIISVVGEFNRGKSSIINQLINSNVCETSINPKTDGYYSVHITNPLVFKKNQFKDKSWRDLSSELFHIGNVSISNKTINKFTSLPKVIIDTPGLQDYENQTNLNDVCVLSDLIIFVLAFEQFLTQSEQELIRRIRNNSPEQKVILVIRMPSDSNDAELKELKSRLLSFVKSNSDVIQPAIYFINKVGLRKLNRHLTSYMLDHCHNETIYKNRHYGIRNTLISVKNQLLSEHTELYKKKEFEDKKESNIKETIISSHELESSKFKTEYHQKLITLRECFQEITSHLNGLDNFKKYGLINSKEIHTLLGLWSDNIKSNNLNAPLSTVFNAQSISNLIVSFDQEITQLIEMYQYSSSIAGKLFSFTKIKIVDPRKNTTLTNHLFSSFYDELKKLLNNEYELEVRKIDSIHKERIKKENKIVSQLSSKELFILEKVRVVDSVINNLELSFG